MIGSLIASGIAGYILGRSNNQNSNHHSCQCHSQYHNQLIEYDKYLDQKKKQEEWNKAEAEWKKKEFERTHCKICGKKIEYKIDSFRRPDTFGNDIKMTVTCGCHVPFVHTATDVDFDFIPPERSLEILRNLFKQGYDELKLREKEKLEQKQRKAW